MCKSASLNNNPEPNCSTIVVPTSNEIQDNVYNPKSEDVPKEHICSHCTKYVHGGIRCKRCDYWYHEICEGLSEDAGQTELKKIDYICTFCNDDILYERRHDIPDEVDIDQHNISNEDLSLTELKQPATVQG